MKLSNIFFLAVENGRSTHLAPTDVANLHSACVHKARNACANNVLNNVNTTRRVNIGRRNIGIMTVYLRAGDFDVPWFLSANGMRLFAL